MSRVESKHKCFIKKIGKNLITGPNKAPFFVWYVFVKLFGR